MVSIMQLIAIAVSCLSFGVDLWLYTWIKAQPTENERIETLGEYIRAGANTFLRREYTILARFVGVIALFIILFIPGPIWLGFPTQNITMAISFLFGTAFSALAGKIGMHVATIANKKTAIAAQYGIKKAFLSGFRGGAVMGMAVVSTSLLGVTDRKSVV